MLNLISCLTCKQIATPPKLSPALKAPYHVSSRFNLDELGKNRLKFCSYGHRHCLYSASEAFICSSIFRAAYGIVLVQQPCWPQGQLPRLQFRPIVPCLSDGDDEKGRTLITDESCEFVLQLKKLLFLPVTTTYWKVLTSKAIVFHPFTFSSAYPVR